VSALVALRRATAADAPCLHRIRSEPSASRFQPLRPYSLDRLARMLAARATLPLDGTLEGKVQWVIEVDGACAGWITLDITSREHGIAAVGYTIAEAFRGQGIASQAVTLLIGIAFDPAGIALERLEAVAAVENAASRRVLTKAGFHEEGIARNLLVIDGVRVDHVRFGLVRNPADSRTGGPSQRGSTMDDT
jgi:RimJ/RimL family protein N-acetyltransferase